jgi:hypothetical protein
METSDSVLNQARDTAKITLGRMCAIGGIEPEKALELYADLSVCGESGCDIWMMAALSLKDILDAVNEYLRSMEEK